MNMPFSNFLIGLCTAAAVTVALRFATGRRGERVGVVHVSAMLIFLIAAVVGVSWAAQGANAVVQLWLALISFSRVTVVTFAAGLACGTLAGMAFGSQEQPRLRRAVPISAYTLAIGALMLLVLKDAISPYLPQPGATGAKGGLYRDSAVEGFRVEELAELTFAPTCIAIGPDGRLYISGFAGMAYQNGMVARIEFSENGPPKETQVAQYLNRPHGLAFHDGALYVSRAGQFSRAVNGKIVQENTGVVTRLRDLDGDGHFDEYTDVVKGLPGAQQPDGLHQNNGIAFDKQGFLYVTVGAPSDHGPAVHRYAGSIIKCRPDGSDVQVVARGFRNPFGIVFGPNGDLFASDNDSSADLGDEVNHVRAGKHYGHPYTSLDARTKVSGAEPPLVQCRSAQGLAFAPAGSLPSEFDGSLFVAAFGENSINRVELTRQGETYKAKMSFFAKIPGVISMAISQDGVIYAVSHYEKKLYRIVRDN